MDPPETESARVAVADDERLEPDHQQPVYKPVEYLHYKHQVARDPSSFENALVSLEPQAAPITDAVQIRRPPSNDHHAVSLISFGAPVPIADAVQIDISDSDNDEQHDDRRESPQASPQTRSTAPNSNFKAHQKVSFKCGGLGLTIIIIVLFTLLVGAIIAASVVCAAGRCFSDGPDPVSPTSPPTPIATIDKSREQSIVRFIQGNSLSGKTFQQPFPESPSSEDLALSWIIRDDPLQLSPQSNPLQLTQRYALATMLYETLTNAWAAKSECLWPGVACDSLVVEGFDSSSFGSIGGVLVRPE